MIQYWKHIFNNFILALLFFIPFYSFACDRTLLVSASSTWVPYSYTDGENFKGLDIEILELILTKNDFCWEYIVFPSSSRAFAELEKGYVDLIFGASYTQERNSFAAFSTAYRNEKMIFFYNNKNQHNKNLIKKLTLSDSPYSLLSNSLIAKNRGSYYGEKFESFKKECSSCLLELSLAKKRFMLLSTDRVDFVVEDHLTGLYLQVAKNIMPGRFIVNRSPTHYMLKKGLFDDKILEKFNLTIRNSEKEIAQIISKYGNI
ncbi:substrate-binding periplasmic protein [Pseudoalteromonas undina]|uniref:Transporter substrate-binding domain-containing protein n=1 Tax=Pseudoalteromonas undina TaxID=43660 RepID=A0ACC6R2P8_9GAMM